MRYFKDKRYKFDKPNISKQSIYEKSKIIVHLSDGTGVLETLSANIPCVFIMPNLNYINIEARKDYQSLVKAKILFFNHKDLTEHINNNYFKIDEWWKNLEVIKIKKSFVISTVLHHLKTT